MIFECLNDECITRYGSKIFILEPVPDCKYLDDGKEIIGDRFSVVGKYDLENISDVGAFINLYSSLEEICHSKLIEELKNEVYKQKRENESIYERLDSCIYQLKRTKISKWLFLIIGIFIGIIINIFI